MIDDGPFNNAETFRYQSGSGSQIPYPKIDQAPAWKWHQTPSVKFGDCHLPLIWSPNLNSTKDSIDCGAQDPSGLDIISIFNSLVKKTKNGI